MVQFREICSYNAREEYSDYIIYRYYLIEDRKTINVDGLNLNLKSYGIKVVKEEAAKGGHNIIEEDLVEDISPNMNKVLELIGFLRNHGVSPVHLIDIIGDKVDEWVKDFDAVINRELKSETYCH